MSSEEVGEQGEIMLLATIRGNVLERANGCRIHRDAQGGKRGELEGKEFDRLAPVVQILSGGGFPGAIESPATGPVGSAKSRLQIRPGELAPTPTLQAGPQADQHLLHPARARWSRPTTGRFGEWQPGGQFESGLF